MSSHLCADGFPADDGAFELLRARFRAGLAERWRRIAQAATPDQCHAELHRLAGTAGSYGYEALGLAARHALEATRAADGAPLASALEALGHLLHEAAARR